MSITVICWSAVIVVAFAIAFYTFITTTAGTDETGGDDYGC